MRTKTIARTLLLLVAVTALVAWAWHLTRPKPISVAVEPAALGKVEKTVANTRAGTVTACRRAQLSPASGGQIAKLPVREGDSVKQGALLLELWNEDLQAELALTRGEARAAIAKSNAACIQAEQHASEYRRQRTLLKRKLVAQENVDKARATALAGAADCDSARATAGVSEAKLKVIQAKIEKTRLIAPFDGVVAEINGELSEFITPSPVGIPTPPAIDLIDNTCFYVAAPIDEVDVAAVRVGMPARISLDAFGKKKLAGKVRRVSPYVLAVEKQARTVRVEVDFVDPADLKTLLAGYSADAEIVIETREQALRVPTSAIVNEKQVYVFDPDGGTVGLRDITVGISNWDQTEVSDGLEPGELVVTSIDRKGLADGVAARREAAKQSSK